METRLKTLRSCFIATGKDLRGYSSDDHLKAVAYRVLASATLESYVEELCLSAATDALNRLQKSQPSATGYSLLAWYAVNQAKGTPLIRSQHQSFWPELATVGEKYKKLVKTNHGLNGDKFLRLTRPLGLQDRHVPDQLLNELDSLADERNPASHAPVNRAKSMRDPELECARPEQIRDLLHDVDDAVATLVALDPYGEDGAPAPPADGAPAEPAP